MTTTPTHHTDTPTFTVRGPEDLVALAPIMLGFAPTDSVVLEGLAGRRPFHARIDLPARRDLDRATADELADTLVTGAGRQGTTAVALLFYSEDEGATDRAWRALRRHCARRGLEILEALRVVPGRYHPLTGDRRVRESGVPCDPATHRFTAQAVAAGMVTRESRDELAATLAPDEAAREEVTARIAASPAREAELATGPDATEWAAGTIADHVADGTPADVDDLARLLRILSVPSARSPVVSLIDEHHALRHIAFWSDVVRRAPQRFAAAPAALLAWAAWRAGQGALGWIAVDRCRAVDPDDPWAALVARALTEALPPEAADVLLATDAPRDA